MELRSSTTVVDGTIVVALEGIADLASLAQLRQALTTAIDRHRGAVISVDVDGLAALDDCALGLLLGSAATARDHGGDLVVICASQAMRDRFERTRLDRAVEVRGSLVG